MSSTSRGILTGADAAVAALEATDAEVAFGLPGVHNLSLWRALGQSPIRLVGVRHEQTAAYAADGYARARGGLGVALTTTGPGAANTLAAVGEAWASRQPVVVIATDVPTTVRRPGRWRGALHEATDQGAMFAPVVKEVIRAGAAEEVGPAVARAARVALAPPQRPVYVEVPTDLLDSAAAEAPVEAAPAPPALDEQALARAAALAGESRAPLLWVGGGAVQSDAGPALARLAERLAAPVILTYSARGLLAPDHPCLVPAPPHVPEVGALWDEADLVIAVGSDLDGMMTQGWAMPAPPRLVAVNVDPADAAKNYAADLVIEADAATAVDRLTDLVDERAGLKELGRRLAAIGAAVRGGVERDEPGAAELLGSMEAVLPADAIVVCDMCIPGYWLGGFRNPDAPRKLAYPLGWGTLGCAFPQGLGAALASRGPAVSVSGDGGFLFACGELAAAAQERIPLTAVVVDDGGYGMLRFDQDRRGDPHEGVDLVTPDFVALARSFGVSAEAVDGLGERFAEALTRQLELEEPSLLVARAAIGPPPNTSPRWYRRN
ncbi:MAG TPA: thiamine pyrophosphate-binding protein [Thermoleophilaceae bacterium]|nr:thiamine pyrophosphate-binding protein [Thermoleophilaceae bacterium]